MTTNTTTNPAVAALLRAARARIENESNFWQCDGKSKRAGRECAAIALQNAVTPRTRQDYFPSYLALNGSAQSLFAMAASEANDQLGHAAVMAMYDHAIWRAEGKPA